MALYKNLRKPYLYSLLLTRKPFHFLMNCKTKKSRNTARLQHLSEKPAEEQVEKMAI